MNKILKGYNSTCITKAQRVALKRVYNRVDLGISYREFRRTVKTGHGYISVRWQGMYLGIEPDGHTHS